MRRLALMQLTHMRRLTHMTADPYATPTHMQQVARLELRPTSPELLRSIPLTTAFI